MDQKHDPTLKQTPNLIINAETSLAYDSNADKLLSLQGNTLTTSNTESGIEKKSHFSIFHLSAPSIVQDKKPTRRADRLRFTPMNAETKMCVTHFGNVLTSYGKKSQIAVANQGFSHGLHYWEIICPNKCAGIEVGVVKDWTDVNSIDKKECITTEFNTSTARTLCLRLDCNNGLLEVWISANQKGKRIHSIPKAKWYPCVIIKELGNIAILNTYSTFEDQSEQVNFSHMTHIKLSLGKLAVSQAKKALSQWTVLSCKSPTSLLYPLGNPQIAAEKFEETSSFFEKLSAPKILQLIKHKDQGIIALKLTRASLSELNLSTFPHSLHFTITSSENVSKLGVKLLKTNKLQNSDEPEPTQVEKWLWKNFSNLAQNYFDEDNESRSLAELASSLPEKISQLPDQPLSQSNVPENVQIHYIKATDSLLVVKDNMLKLLNKENGTFTFENLLSFNRPIGPLDLVTLVLEKNKLAQTVSKVINAINPADLFSDYASAISLLYFLQAVELAIKTKSFHHNKLIVQINYKYAKRAINYLTLILNNSLKWIESLVSDKKGSKIHGLLLKNVNEDEINYLLSFVLEIDEALYSMTMHEEASDKLLNYWKTSQARVFSSLARIETLFSLPSSQYDIVKMADLGLLNSPLLYYEFKHFLNTCISLDSDKIIGSNDKEITAMLEQILPNNRLLKSLPTANVNFQQFLNNLPPQLCSSKILDVIINPELAFLFTVHDNGKLSYFSANKALVYLGSSDFSQSQEFKKPKLFKKKLNKTATSTTTQNQPLFGGGFGIQPMNMNLAGDMTTFQEPKELDEENEEESLDKESIEPAPPGISFGTFSSSTGFGPAPMANWGSFETASTKPKAKKEGKKILGLDTLEKKDINKNLLTIVEESQKDLNSPSVAIKNALIGSAFIKEGDEPEKTLILPADISKSKEDMLELNDPDTPVEKLTLPSMDIKPVSKLTIEKPHESESVSLFKPSVQKALLLPTSSELEKKQDNSEKSEPEKSDLSDKKKSIKAKKVKDFGQESFGFGKSSGLFGNPSINIIGTDEKIISSDWDTGLSEDNGLFGAAAFPKLGSKSPQTANKTEGPKEPVLNLAGATVLGNILIPISATPLSPAIFGFAFKKDNEIVLRFRRLGYSPAYIKKFFHENEGIFSLLNSKFFDYKNFDDIQTHLTYEYGLVFTTLEPLIFGSERYRKARNSEMLINAEWKPLEQFDFKLNIEQYIDMAPLSSIDTDKETETRHFVVLGKKGENFTLTSMRLKNLKKNPYDVDIPKAKSFEVIQGATKELQISATEGQGKIFSVNEKIVLFESSSNSLYLFDKNLEPLQTIPLKSKVTSIRALSAEVLGLIDSENNITTYSYDTKSSEISHQSLKRGISSSDHLKDILDAPLRNLQHICSVVEDSTDSEKLVEKFYHRVHDSLTSFTIPLDENACYSRVSLQLQFSRKSLQSLTTDEETIVRAAILSSMDKEVTKIENIEENDFPLFEKASIDPAALKYLPIKACNVYGGSFNQSLPAACMTTPSLEIFASKYAGAEFTFAHLHEKTVLIDSVTISAPLKSSGLGAYPIESGFIYLADSLAALSKLSVPKVGSEAEFKLWHHNRRAAKGRILENEPVGYFQMKHNKETDNFDLLEKRPAKYILLKPLGLRNGERILSAEQHPVEISFFGLHGLALEKSVKNAKSILREINYLKETSFKIQVEGKFFDDWTPIQTVDEASLAYSFRDLNQIKIEDENISKKLPFSTYSSIDISNELLEQGGYSQLRVTLIPNLKTDWTLCGTLVENYVPKTDKIDILSFEAATKLKQKLFSTSFKDLIPAFSSSLNDSSRLINERKKIAHILHIIIGEKPDLADDLIKNISLEKYIIVNILPEIRDTSYEFLSLFRRLSARPNFKKNLATALSSILPRVADVPNITNRGIRTLFTLLHWSSPNKESIELSVSEIMKLAQRVSSSRVPEYRILRSQYNVPLLSFERELFDENFILQLGEERAAQRISTAERPIRCKFIHDVTPESDEYLIDLQQTHDLSLLKLNFCEYDKLCKLRVQVWSLTEVNGQIRQNLLLSNSFNDTEGVWLQVTKHSHEPSLIKYFNDSEQLTQLGFSLNIRARYLMVQLTYSFRAGIPCLLKDPQSKKAILPLVIGHSTNIENDSIEALAKRFDVKSTASFKQSIAVSSWLSYDKFDGIPECPTAFLYEPTAKENVKDDSLLIKDSEYDLTASIGSLQGELYNVLYQQRNPQFFFQSQQKVIELCQNIQDCQIKLFNLTHDVENNSKESHPSLAVYLFLIEAYAQFVLKLVNNNNKSPLLSNDQIIELYDSILQLESTSYLPGLYRIVENHSFSLLTPKKQEELAQAIFKKYLTTSISLFEGDVEKLSPTLPIVKILTNLGVNNPHLLNVFLDDLGEKNLIVGYSYSLVIINEIYSVLLADPNKKNIDDELNKKTVSTLFRNLTYIIDSPEFTETEKQNLVGFVADILVNIAEVVSPKITDLLYIHPVEMFRIFHYFTRNNLNDLRFKLVKLLNISRLQLREKYGLEDKDSRMKAILQHKEDPYCSFVTESLRALVEFSTKPNSKNPLMEKIPHNITSEEWQGLLKVILMHVQLILESDRKDQISFFKKELKAKKKEDALKLKTESTPKEKDEEKEASVKAEKDEKEEVEEEKEDDKDEKPIEKELEDSSDEEDDYEKEKAIKEKSYIAQRKARKAAMREWIETSLIQELCVLEDKFSDKEATISSIIYDLVTLLSQQDSQRKSFNFAENRENWLSTLRILACFKISDELSVKIVPILLNAFLAISPDVQDYVWAFVSMIFKALSFDTLELIPHFANAFQASFQNQTNSKNKNFLSVSLLVSAALEKVRKTYKSKDSKLKGSIDVKTTKQIVQIIVDTTKSLFSIGGRVLSAFYSEEQTQQIISLEALYELVDISALEDSSPISLKALLANYQENKELVDKLANTLINFYILNKPLASESNNPPIKSIINITKKVKSILETLADHKEALKVAVKFLLESFEKNLDIISEITIKKQTKGYIVYNYAKQICEAFEELAIAWLTNNEIITYFSQELNGFDYLLKILNLSKISKGVIPPLFDHNEIAQYFSKRYLAPNPEDISFMDLYQTKNTEFELTEEEFANKVKLHRMKGQKWPKYPLDLTVNKQTNSKVLSFFIDAEEYCLCLEFDTCFELKTILVSLVNIQDYLLENQIVFPEMYAEAGPTLGNMSYIGKLKGESNQNAYNNIFALTVDRVNGNLDSPVDELLTSIPQIRVKYIKLRFRRPVIRFFESFGFSETKAFKNIVVNISFISVTGIDINKYRNYKDQILESTQSTAMRVIDHISLNKEAWQVLSDDEFYLQKSQASIDAISSLIDINSPLITKILLSFSKGCEKIGNWLFEKLLESPRSVKYSSFVGELIATDLSRVIRRLDKLNRFLLNEAKSLASVKSPEKYTNEFESLLHFIDILTTTMHIIPESPNTKPTVLDVSTTDLQNLIELYHKFIKINIGTSKITKLIINYIVPPKTFIVKDPEIMNLALSSSYKLYSSTSNLILLEFIGPISISSPSANQWLCKELEALSAVILKDIQQKPDGQLKSLMPHFTFLNTIAKNPTLKEKIVSLKLHLKLYQALHQTDPKSTSILRTTDNDLINSLLLFIKSVILGNNQYEQEFVNYLKDDLLQLSKITDNCYLEFFLLPIIKSELEVPVCLFPYDVDSRQWILDLQSSTVGARELKFASKLFKSEQIAAFNSTFKRLTKRQGTFSKYNEMSWVKVFSSAMDGDQTLVPTLNEKASGKGPFVLIMEGTPNSYSNFVGAVNAPQSKKAYAGLFCGNNLPTLAQSSNYYANMEKNLDGFMFYYDDKKRLHFPLHESRNKNLANINLYPNGGGISFYYNSACPIFFSLFPGQFSYCSFDLLNIKPTEDLDDKFSVLSINQFTNIEVWVLREDASKQTTTSKSVSLVKDSNILRKDWFKTQDPLNYFRPMPVYNIPSSIQINQLSESFFKERLGLSLKGSEQPIDPEKTLMTLHEEIMKSSENHGIIDIRFDYKKYLDLKNSNTFIVDLPKAKYTPNMSIFEAFKRNEGIECIIQVATINIDKWKKKDIAAKWKQWINDLKSLSDFPNFFEAFIKNSESVDLLFQILASKPDEEAQKSEEDAKKWEDKQEISNKYIYQAFADSFTMVPSAQACQLAIESNKFKNILEILEVITKEKPRRFVENPELEEANPIKKEIPIIEPKKEDIEDSQLKKGKKKGVGYGSDYFNNLSFSMQGGKAPADSWNVSKFVEKKKMKNDQIMSLINVITSMFETKDWEPPQNVVIMICESALLPLLESAFRNGSLVDMGKESELFLAYLRLVKAMSKRKTLIPALLELDSHYQPKQRDSVFNLLSHMNDISKIFINCLSTTEIKKSEEEKKEEEVPAQPTYNPNFGFDQPQNDVNNAWKYINKPLKYSKATYGATSKEFIAQPAINSNNPDLLPMQNLYNFGSMPPYKGGDKVIKEEKKIEKKPKPSVFTSSVTKNEKKSDEKTESESKTKLDKGSLKDIPEEDKQFFSGVKIAKKKKTSHKSKKGKAAEPSPQEKDEEAQQNEKLAHEIIETFDLVKKEIAIFKAQEKSKVSITEILQKPLKESYRTLLQDLRFDYMDMKDPNSGMYIHHYASSISSSSPPQSKMIRLAQELADLSNSLPTEHTNSIFVRVDKSRVDLMKVIIMGSSHTPYGHGAFEYDVYFDDQYPNHPPKVNLMTTGSGAVRFNPNLYANGKVCLSLLGTWSGRGGENWNPTLSTFLQVLLSIQSLIMSEDIYFNEPGLEVHAGTEQGELDNEGYSNVVRYSNIKYAMVRQIRNPPKGFESVIKRHFYLKKQEILEECNQWIKWGKTKNASYAGCQNYNWQRTFQQSKEKYYEMMVEVVKELQEELDKISPPSEDDIQEVSETKKRTKADKARKIDNVKTEEIDVSYDKEIKIRELDINDENFKDRYSRYIGALGFEAVAKQANSQVLLSGLGPLGVEIAKNIVLSGVKRFTIHDSQKATLKDLSAQFFIDKEDIGKNRASASLNKIQQLNAYVKVDTLLLDEKLPNSVEAIEKSGFNDYNIIILTEADDETIIAFDTFCRKRGAKLIVADVHGPFSRIFNDFGEEFIVVDKSGEEINEILIKSISNEEHGIISCLESNKHNLEDGDLILISEVVGMETKDGKASINGTYHKVKVISAFNVQIGDTRNFSPYNFNGKLKKVKQPLALKFLPYEKANSLAHPLLDQNLLFSDCAKINAPILNHIAFTTLQNFRSTHARLPTAWDSKDAEEFISIAEKLTSNIKLSSDVKNELPDFLKKFAFTCAGVFPPLNAFIGGFVSQEAIKAMTGLFVPVAQLFYNDCIEVIPDLSEGSSLVQKNDRYDSIRTVIGKNLLEKIAKSNIFMVGVGAIGCELLKNYAMIGAGTDGKIVITDPDVIETSNLNRQFLFREKHLRKPKSQTAAAAIYLMNSDLKGHVTARLDKVHSETSDIFTDAFFEEQTVVTNALDNIQARRYVDSRCVKAKTPLIESGTLGPKGHVQVILPYKTESYGSQQDPQDENEIPHCTLKMFPEETLHCVEWARDKFGKLFTQKPKSLSKLLLDPEFKPTTTQELQTLKEAIKLLKNRPTDFDDCVRYAREKFQKYFVNDIRQLIFTYPLDHKTKEGSLFWSSPKRPPTELKFNPEDKLHAAFIVACACLRAVIFKIPYPNDVWKENTKLKIAQEAARLKVKDFKPSAEKAKAISSEVDAEKKKPEPAQEEENKVEETPLDEFEAYTMEYKKLISGLDLDDKKQLKELIFPEEFEKDNDKNFHIDFIHSLANSRSSNYKLEPMEWMTVKIKAGRIVPALATTTSSIAGLQTIELVKVIKGNKVDEIKNAFMNFAVPYLTLSEPGPAKVVKLTEQVSVTVWDRWDLKLGKKVSLNDVFSQIKKKYGLDSKDVFYESRAVYSKKVMDNPGKEAEREKILKSELRALLELEDDAKYVDLTITLSKQGSDELLKDTPPVRVYFDQ